MQFTISTCSSLSEITLPHKLGNFYYNFDDRVHSKLDGDKFIFWFGVSWPIKLQLVTEETIINQSGSWFYGVITQDKVTVYTDLCANYPIYYFTDGADCIVSNVFNNFSKTKFTINHNWIVDALGRNYYVDQYLPKVDINIVNCNYEFCNNTTALNNVRRMPHCGKLSLGSETVVSQYFDRKQSFKDALSLPKIDDIDTLTKLKINENIAHIISQQEGNIGVLSSTGVDSLTIVETLLSQHQDFKVASYGFDTSSILSEWVNNAKKLHNYLNGIGIDSKFDKIKPSEFYNRFRHDTWTVPSKFDDLYQDTFATMTILNDCDYLIKGTNGDECFLHAQRYAMIYLAASLKVPYDEAIDICKQHYSYQGKYAYVSEFDYQVMLQHKLFDTIIDTWALKPLTYLADDQVFTDKPTFSPYCDRELAVITARMKPVDLEATILDARPQRAMLEKTGKFLNRYKSGEQDIMNYNFALTEFAVEQLQFLEQYIQNNSLTEHLQSIIQIIRDVKVGSMHHYDLLRYVQLATWLQTRQ